MDIRTRNELPDAYLLSDHMNFSEGEEDLIRDVDKVSVGPKILHADHTITIMLNEMDRRENPSKS